MLRSATDFAAAQIVAQPLLDRALFLFDGHLN
jgi:hypothetical protein